MANYAHDVVMRDKEIAELKKRNQELQLTININMDFEKAQDARVNKVENELSILRQEYKASTIRKDERIALLESYNREEINLKWILEGKNKSLESDLEIERKNNEHLALKRAELISENNVLKSEMEFLELDKVKSLNMELYNALRKLFSLAEDGYTSHQRNGCHREFLQEDEDDLSNAKKAMSKYENNNL